MSSHVVQRCARCGRIFHQGQARYLVTINLVADFDGTIEAPGDEAAAARMWEEIERKSEEELLDEVYQKLSFILCKPCRDCWVSSPLGKDRAEGGPSAGCLH